MPFPHRHPVTSLALSGLALLALVGTGACSNQETATPTPTTAAAGGAPTIKGLHDDGPVTPATGPLEGCISKVPGEFLSEAEAIVRLSPSAVCPGYVTVKPGTTVTFRNTDTAPHTLVVTPGTGAPTTTERDPSAPSTAVPTTAAQAPVLSTTIPAGGAATQKFDAPGQFTFTTDAIPGYRGTVEVRS